MKEASDFGNVLVGSLSLKHSPDKVKAILEAAEKTMARPSGSQLTAPSPAARPHRRRASLSPGQGARDDGPLRHPGRSQRGRGEAAGGVPSCCQGWKQRYLAPASSRSPLKGKELFTYNTYSMAMLANKRIPVTESVWVELSGLKSAGQTYSDLLEEMIEDRKKARLFRDMERIEKEDEFAEFPW